MGMKPQRQGRGSIAAATRSAPRRWRRNEDEITLFKSVATALEDLCAARLVVAGA